MRASQNNSGESHENGSIEARQGSLKVSLEQSLLLRGSREFDEVAEYEQFAAETVRRLNARCARAREVERASLRPLPVRRTADFDKLDARVNKFGVFSAKGVLYSPVARGGPTAEGSPVQGPPAAWLGGVKVSQCEPCTPTAAADIPSGSTGAICCRPDAKGGSVRRLGVRDAMFPRTEYDRPGST